MKNRMIEFANGDKRWYRDGKLHREDGPAVEFADGDKEWYRDGKRHREDGPAVESANGDKLWYRDDKLHREDGPAVESANGYKAWYREGKKIDEKQIKLLDALKNYESIRDSMQSPAFRWEDIVDAGNALAEAVRTYLE